MVYNSASGTGYLYNTLRYRMQRMKPDSVTPLMDEMENLSLDGDRSMSEDEKNGLLMFFRSCNLRTEKDELITTLKRTIAFRRMLLQDEKKPIIEMFPFYFAEPTLVCTSRNNSHDIFSMNNRIHSFQILQDFEIMFPDIDSQSLVTKWPVLQPKIDKMQKPKLDASIDKLDVSINQFLTICNRLKPQRTQFATVVNNFIVFDKVHCNFLGN